MSANGRLLSLRDVETSYSKAAKAELDREYDCAFRLYIEAAENYLHLSRTAIDQSVRVLCKTQAGKALERAEKIKRSKKDLEPVTSNHFSEQSQLAVLKKSSVINNAYFPLQSKNASDVTTSTATAQPSMSIEQKAHGAIWKRPYTPKDNISPADELFPEDILQHVVSDCSVCASIAVCIDHNRRFNSKLGISALQQQVENGAAGTSETTCYQWEAFYNGAPRRIEIDDQLPCYPDGELMCVSTGNKQQLLPSLIEKAYMKLMGGYDFPGSDSGIDLHAMTGWIPEALEIRSSSFERERTWRRIVDGYILGLCVLTLGTGEALSSAAEISPMALKPVHCYAVVGVQDSDEDRTMTVLDSEYHEDAVNGDSELSMGGLSLDNNELRGVARSYALPWDAVCQVFDGIYLSWSPEMFKQTLKFHGSWKRASTEIEQMTHFQLTLRVNPPQVVEEDVWILLTRHVVDTTRTSEFIALSAQSPQSSNVNEMYMKGSYTSSTHVLVKTRVSSASPDLAIVCSYDGDYDDVGFTVTVYSSAPASWMEESVKMSYNKTMASAFTTKNAGGNSTYSSFMVNPQYHLRINYDNTLTPANGREKKPRMQLKVQGDRRIPFNISIVWTGSQDRRVRDVVQNEIAATSGAYTHGFASITKKLAAGDYTVIVSAFEPRYFGPFSLTVGGTHRFELTPIPQEGAGMFSKVVRGAWTEVTSAGGPSFKQYTSNPCYEMTVSSQTEVKIRLQVVDAPRPLSINATVFNLNGDTLGSHVTTSGPYSDANSGVITPQIMLQPARYVIVPSTYSPGLEASFRLIVYSTDSGILVTSTVLGSAH